MLIVNEKTTVTNKEIDSNKELKETKTHDEMICNFLELAHQKKGHYTRKQTMCMRINKQNFLNLKKKDEQI